MAKNFAVDFRGKVPRIIKDPEEIVALSQEDLVVLNPDISGVRGVSPSFWKLGDNGVIVAVDPTTAISRDRELAREAAMDRVVEKVDFSTVRDEIESKLQSILKGQGLLLEEIREETRVVKERLKGLIIFLALFGLYFLVKGFAQ